jgi:hypothetical protein
MSDAKVKFEMLGGEDALTGSEQQFSFNCPLHDRCCGPLIIAWRTNLKRDPQGKNGGVAQWGWDGNRETPTFSPSVNCKGCWHGHIRKGRCVSTSNADEPEINRRAGT